VLPIDEEPCRLLMQKRRLRLICLKAGRVYEDYVNPAQSGRKCPG
jgi:hypothetical protein